MYSIENCSHNDPLMSRGRAGVTPGRGGGTKTLTSSPNRATVILYFQSNQMHCGSPGVAKEKNSSFAREINMVPSPRRADV